MELGEVLRNRARKKTPLAYGITTADKYLLSLARVVGAYNCYKWWNNGKENFWDLMSRSSRLLVYSDPGMVVEVAESNASRWKSLVGDLGGVEVPKNTLVVFRHVLTTSRKDRDGDILRSDGAIIDPKMLLLWQHVPVNPIGKYLATVHQDESKLVVVSAVVDIGPLSHDAAVMVENGMGRFSHGFRALEWEVIKERTEDGREVSNGYDVKRFEILEESLVSVPANPDAEVEEVLLGLEGRRKFRSPEMKALCSGLRRMRRKKVFGNGWFFGGDEDDGRDSQRGGKESFARGGEEGVKGVAKQEANISKARGKERARGANFPKVGREERHMKRGKASKAEAVRLNEAGYQQAERLIKQGNYVLDESWEPPSAEAENAFLEENGMEEYSNWFLGVRPNVDPETKGAWAYPYSGDFQSVSRAGLIAIRQRAGQQGEEDIFEAAGKLLELINDAEGIGEEEEEEGGEEEGAEAEQKQDAVFGLDEGDMGLLREVLEDLVELEGMDGLTRAARALVQSARGKLEELLSKLDGGGEGGEGAEAEADGDGDGDGEGAEEARSFVGEAKGGLSLCELVFNSEKRRRLKALIDSLEEEGGDRYE